MADFDVLPYGTFYGTANGKRYVVTKSQVVGGRGEKLAAEAPDGSDYVSCNVYRLASGVRLKPCEMPREKVIEFVTALRPNN